MEKTVALATVFVSVTVELRLTSLHKSDEWHNVYVA
jgi:hypothetical protein